jgi:hypothetical protein
VGNEHDGLIFLIEHLRDRVDIVPHRDRPRRAPVTTMTGHVRGDDLVAGRFEAGE